MHRFFFSVAAEQSLPVAAGNVVGLSRDDAAHIARVLRLTPGDAVVLLDGRAYEYEATLTEVSPRSVRARLGPSRPVRGEPALSLTLVQGVPKGTKMDLIVQKATEVGVSRVVPVFTERTVVRLDEGRAASRRDRWQRIAYEAAKQAGRGRVPEVEAPMPLSSLWARDDLGLLIVPWEDAEGTGLRQLLVEEGGFTPSRKRTAGRGGSAPDASPRRATIVIGPEGGLSRDEVEAAKRSGGRVVTLGPRVLRTETAAIVAAAVTMFAAGEMD